MNEGFYKYTEGDLLYGPTVHNKDFTLKLETANQESYPVDGWYYFNSVQEACIFFNIPIPRNLVTED